MTDTTNPEQRVAELEQRLEELREAAVSIIVEMVPRMAATPEGRAELARAFDEIAQARTGEMQDLALEVAAALRAK